MSGEAGHSGRILLRIPKTLHADLATAAAVEGVSLNQFAAASLAAAVGWRRPDRDEISAERLARRGAGTGR